jgi:hypothetical protein
MYEMPFEYVKREVKPVRQKSRSKKLREYWWIHRRPGPDMREAVSSLTRFIATPSVAKYRLFVWLKGTTIPDHQLYTFARDDDYFFGVLHSRVHEIWSLQQGSSLEDRPRYTPKSTFETFPFPWPPGNEPTADPRVQAIAAAARELVEKRDVWLNPPGLSQKQLRQRTLTNLYNQRPLTWLDHAVLDAYGWPHDLTDEQKRLLALDHAVTSRRLLAGPTMPVASINHRPQRTRKRSSCKSLPFFLALRATSPRPQPRPHQQKRTPTSSKTNSPSTTLSSTSPFKSSNSRSPLKPLPCASSRSSNNPSAKTASTGKPASPTRPKTALKTSTTCWNA